MRPDAILAGGPGERPAPSWIEKEEVRGSFGRPELLGLAGIDRLRAGERGLMAPPPIHHLFGLRPVAAGHAGSTFSMPASPWLETGAEVFLGGTAALVADAPLGSAVLAPLGPGQLIVTSDLTLNYMRPLTVESQRIIARARPVDIGRRLGLSTAIIEDGFGQVVAHATSRCFVLTLDGIGPLEGELEPVEVPEYEGPDPYQRPVTTAPVPDEIWETKTSLEIFDEIRMGKLPNPPHAELFGFGEPVAVEGEFATTAPATAWLCSPAGTVYGGFLAFLADNVLTCAISTTLPAGSMCAPLDLKINFIRPVFPDGRLLEARAKVTHRGRSFALASAEIVNADGKPVAMASSSAAVMPYRFWSRTAVADDAPVQAE